MQLHGYRNTVGVHVCVGVCMCLSVSVCALGEGEWGTRLWIEDIKRKRGGCRGAYFTEAPPLCAVYPHCYECTDL